MYLGISVHLEGQHVLKALCVLVICVWGYGCLKSYVGLGSLHVLWTSCSGAFCMQEPHVLGNACFWSSVCFKHLWIF